MKKSSRRPDVSHFIISPSTKEPGGRGGWRLHGSSIVVAFYREHQPGPTDRSCTPRVWRHGSLTSRSRWEEPRRLPMTSYARYVGGGGGSTSLFRALCEELLGSLLPGDVCFCWVQRQGWEVIGQSGLKHCQISSGGLARIGFLPVEQVLIFFRGARRSGNSLSKLLIRFDKSCGKLKTIRTVEKQILLQLLMYNGTFCVDKSPWWKLKQSCGSLEYFYRVASIIFNLLNIRAGSTVQRVRDIMKLTWKKVYFS